VTPLPTRKPGLVRVLAGEAAHAVLASAGALLLLGYTHRELQPWWAVGIGLVAGIGLRRLVAPAFAAFPPFLRRFLDGGVAAVAVLLLSWATLGLYPFAYWVLRWQQAVALPTLAVGLCAGLAGLVVTGRRLQKEIEAQEARLAALRQAELAARLRALQAQINPHFLFNSLNTLAEMVHGDPDTSEQFVGDLAHLLRYSLRSSASGVVPLQQELDATERYLRLEQARHGARLRVERDVDEAQGTVSVPGLVLQPLVENAVRHAVAPRSEGGTIRLEVRAAGERLVLVVQDDGPGMPDEVVARLQTAGADGRLPVPVGPGAEHGTGGAGGGLANVRQRLALTFGEQGTMEITRPADGGTRIELGVPR